MPPLLCIIILGYFLNSILPARAEELVRARFLDRREDCSAATIPATIVLEKVLDELCLLLFLALSLFLIPAPLGVRSIAYLPGPVFLGCLEALLCTAYRRQLAF